MPRNSDSSRAASEPFRDELSVPRRRVLVADDQPRMLEVVAAVIEKSFGVVDLVPDGRAALTAILALDPDLAVLDISMPGMTGIEVATEIRNRSCKAKVVFLTVHEDPQILAKCLAAGGLGYVLKERMDSDLIPAMNEALAGRVFVSRFTSESIPP